MATLKNLININTNIDNHNFIINLLVFPGNNPRLLLLVAILCVIFGEATWKEICLDIRILHLSSTAFAQDFMISKINDNEMVKFANNSTMTTITQAACDIRE